MDITNLLESELRGSLDFYLHFTNRDTQSPGFGLTVDSTKHPRVASIAATGFALSAWVIAAERGYLPRQQALTLACGTLETLWCRVPHHRGFMAHFLDMDSAARVNQCEYSTIDTALCLNGAITAAAYFQDAALEQMAHQLLARVDWDDLVCEQPGRTLFAMAYNPDHAGECIAGRPGQFGHWDMAAEQKMMYLQAAAHLEPARASALYRGFARDGGDYAGQRVIVCPGGSLFVYQYSEAWLDTRAYLDPDEVDWFNNTRLATLANRDFCLANAGQHRTYHARSWGLSAGDSPWGYDVSGSAPCLESPRHNGTVSIWSALSALPFAPELVTDMALYLYHEQPQTWGPYGFYDAYNLAVSPAWYSQALYGINKGCSMIMIENYLTGLIWNTYTQSATIQKALAVLGFQQRQGAYDGEVLRAGRPVLAG